MLNEYVTIEESSPLKGQVKLEGAKNAVLAIMASLILTSGKSRLTNVPASSDVYQMIQLLSDLGAQVLFDADNNTLQVDTTLLQQWRICPEIMKKMRASILVMGPLLARHGRADVALPGGCLIGARPIDLHLKAFARMGVAIEVVGEYLQAHVVNLKAQRFVLDYPSVGATENILMAAVLTKGVTEVVNAALEPEVLDLIEVLRKMGAQITFGQPAMLRVEGVEHLKPIEHRVMSDRLEAGTLLLAAAITGGEVEVLGVPVESMELFLQKLEEMGHRLTVNADKTVRLQATREPGPISFKTMPYPGFPTDLQAPIMAALCLASGTSTIHETVFENRMLHVRELQKMGAQIELHGSTAKVNGVEQLYGAQVIATDIRASAALVLAGLVARGITTMTGVHHLKRGYHGIEQKLQSLGADVRIVCDKDPLVLKGSKSVRPMVSK